MTQSRKRLGLSVPENLYKNILEKAEYQGKTINSTCIDIFWEYFEKQDKKEQENVTKVVIR